MERAAPAGAAAAAAAAARSSGTGSEPVVGMQQMSPTALWTTDTSGPEADAAPHVPIAQGARSWLVTDEQGVVWVVNGQVRMRRPHVPQISETEYQCAHWPRLREALMVMLRGAVGEQRQLSQESILRDVYNVCCSRLALTLFEDVRDYLVESMHGIRVVLTSTPDQALPFSLIDVLTRYLVSRQVISSCFNYLERHFIEPKLGTKMGSVVDDLFQTEVLQTSPLSERIAKLINEYQEGHESVVLIVHALGLVNPELIAGFVDAATYTQADASTVCRNMRAYAARVLQENGEIASAFASDPFSMFHQSKLPGAPGEIFGNPFLSEASIAAARANKQSTEAMLQQLREHHSSVVSERKRRMRELAQDDMDARKRCRP